MRTSILARPSIQRARAALPPLLGVLFASLIIASCGGDEEFNDSPCDIPSNRLVSGGIPAEGIPALTLPPMVPASEENYLSNTDRVLGVVLNGVARAYPHRPFETHWVPPPPPIAVSRALNFRSAATY